MAARCPFLEQLEQMPRLTEARYADGLGALYAQTDPMEIARHIFDQSGDIPNPGGLSTLFTTWGQFLDHDLSLTPEDEAGKHIHVDGFARDVSRSEAMEGTGAAGPREYGNGITWQIDGSQIYGSNAGREADLRSFEGGKLRMIDDPTSTHGLLPLATEDTVMAGETSGPDAVFLAGDIRASENPNLLSLHTLFAREHNYWAARLAEEHPDWNDQELFEVARSIVEYELQSITYDQWLPHLIGNTFPSDDIAHDPDETGQVSLEFSTAAFRFGHTLVSGHMPRLNEDGSIFGEGHLALLDTFFNPEPVKTGGIDALIRGQAALHAQELDTKVVDDLNFFLATADGVSGFSLPALNLIRGADHGMGSYLDTRAQLMGDIDRASLDPADFSIITSDLELQAQLAGVYESVFDVDLWVGGLAEDKIAGTQMGPLFTHILSDQFYRTAAADQSFGELDPRIGADMLAEVAQSGLKDIILRTTDIDTLQDDPFLHAPRELTFEALVFGSEGADRMALEAVATGTVATGPGNDILTLTGGSAIDGKLDLGAGADKLFMSSGQTLYDIDMGHGASDEVVDLSGTAQVGDDVMTRGGHNVIRMTDMARVLDDVVTQDGDDHITLAGKAQVLGRVAAGLGHDHITLSDDALAGNIDAGGGDDLILLLDDSQAGHVDGGAGFDILSLGDRAFRIDDLDGDAGTLVFLNADGTETGQTLNFTSIEHLDQGASASDGDDALIGSRAGDIIDGGAGDDIAHGLDGHDTLVGGSGDDTLLGGARGDILRGDDGADILRGGSGFDRMAGNGGRDLLDGGKGDDTLYGGAAADQILGGAGDDVIWAGMGRD
ncbi:MAG: peroxidase family protein, partial [Pseudomonadota bacterium]